MEFGVMGMAYLDWSQKLLKMSGSWVLVCVILLILFKGLIFLLRNKKLSVFIACFKGIWAVFFILYYGLICIFIYQFLIYPSFGDPVREIGMTLIIFGLAVLFWIGPVRGMLGLKATRTHPEAAGGSKDGWVIESWWGEEGLPERNRDSGK
ncbi:hypothetical protein H1R82_04280 [Thermoactinomyces intermedius]|uniref:Uncharacterized protein n=1 Tax=Thermoactinomyces intermedius TaxID=2024 RepID=A0A8I1DDY9_THEIN|nr:MULTISPECIES: hypothetical protein [Thermoactinomyces]MBA4548509.1 hypothetical protein [Thermoactinomyces intermedius]MBA4835851.1 hypothetical protein [Thermoactinomyces intermedius]MBH8594387.1 hypothetical protein [Thermoactinomyces intermedius]MBH8601708.1 hypothetical protein [Thermoactinomyces sp. CICC 23799]